MGVDKLTVVMNLAGKVGIISTRRLQYDLFRDLVSTSQCGLAAKISLTLEPFVSL